MFKTKIPEELITGSEVWKSTITGIDEVQWLHVDPKTSINLHGHDKNQWEVWLCLSNQTAYICLKGEKHELVNTSEKVLNIMAIKGHDDYSYGEFGEFFKKLGFSVFHGSLKR